MSAVVMRLPARTSGLGPIEARVGAARRLLKGDLLDALRARVEIERADDDCHRLTKLLGLPRHGSPEAAMMVSALHLWREVDEVAEMVEKKIVRVRRRLPTIGGHQQAQNDRG